MRPKPLFVDNRRVDNRTFIIVAVVLSGAQTARENRARFCDIIAVFIIVCAFAAAGVLVFGRGVDFFGVAAAGRFQCARRNVAAAGVYGIVVCAGGLYGIVHCRKCSAGVLSVGIGQSEAYCALGLRRPAGMRLVIIPLALRVIIPPLTNQYLNITKNSSLAVPLHIRNWFRFLPALY